MYYPRGNDAGAVALAVAPIRKHGEEITVWQFISTLQVLDVVMVLSGTWPEPRPLGRVEASSQLWSTASRNPPSVTPS